jgi:hypothetical protein
MKRIVSVTMFSACLAAVSPVVRAQDCSNISNYDLRGTYVMMGSGYVDLSKTLPGVPGLPSGFIPAAWMGAPYWDGRGGGGGWISVNAGGNQLTASFVGMKYSIKPDCSIQLSYSMKFNELGVTVGPFQRLMVPAFKAGSLEVYMMEMGTPPGTPTGSGIDTGVAHRISMQF